MRAFVSLIVGMIVMLLFVVSGLIAALVVLLGLTWVIDIVARLGGGRRRPDADVGIVTGT